MLKSTVALALLFAPTLMLGYYYLGKLLLRSTEAAGFLNGGGEGSISTQELHDYESQLNNFVYFGLLSALFLAVEAARVIHRRLPTATVLTDDGSTDHPNR